MLLTILKKRQWRASARLCWRERLSKVSSMFNPCFTRPCVKSATRLTGSSSLNCLNQIYLIFMLGIPKVAAYSSCGRTRVVLAASLTPGIFVLMFLCTKPRVLWAVPVILSMCESQDKLLEMSTPRYLAQVTVSRATSCSA